MHRPKDRPSTMVTSSHEALITGFVCSGCSMAILLLRIVTARIQNGRFDLSSIICVASIVVVSARLAVNQFVLSYGTVNDALFGKSDYFDAEDLRRLKVGSILSLVARLLITTFYWMQNCLLLLFYSHIFSQVRVRWATVLIRMCWVAIPLTYIAVVLATLSGMPSVEVVLAGEAPSWPLHKSLYSAAHPGNIQHRPRPPSFGNRDPASARSKPITR